MTQKTVVHTLAHQDETRISSFQNYVFIEQVATHGGDEAVISIALQNVDSFIEALKKAKQQALAEGL